MGEFETALARALCHRHVLAKAREHGIALKRADVARIEAMAERCLPAFERPGADRYLLRVNRGRQRLRFVYDAPLACFVSVWERRGPRHG